MAMKNGRIGSMAAAMAAAVVATAPRMAQACAMCGLPPGDSAGHAYNASVLFMLIGPYATILGIGGIVFAIWKRGQRKESASVVSTAPRR
jgi:hypothetical protein